MQMARHSRCFCRKQGEMRQVSVEVRLRFLSLQCAPGAHQWGEAVLPPGTTCVSSLACCMRPSLPEEGLKLWRHTATGPLTPFPAMDAIMPLSHRMSQGLTHI